MKKLLLLLLLLLLLIPITMMAQPPSWPPGNGKPPAVPPGQIGCWPPPCVPIGEYIPIVLVGTAIFLAGLKLKKKLLKY